MTQLEHLRQDTGDLPWAPGGTPGVEVQLLAPPDAQDSARTTRVRLAAGALWAPDDGVAVLVLEGSWSTSHGELTPGEYGRIPSSSGEVTASAEGCTLFVKSYPAGDPGAELPHLHIASAGQPWLPGHGRLRVKPLADDPRHGAALVHWPTNERFVRHQHFGGEEILVLSGTFQDEHGSYPAGTWLRSPHLSVHHPHVEEETVIFVRTGHLNAE
ncbi:cupin domain-containing protein [Planctomycetota bacterium]|nr:cupin domain-containing protein [Planctomycetota bacterium]